MAKKASREGLPRYPLSSAIRTWTAAAGPEFVALMQQLKTQAEQFRSTL